MKLLVFIIKKVKRKMLIKSNSNQLLRIRQIYLDYKRAVVLFLSIKVLYYSVSNKF